MHRSLSFAEHFQGLLKNTGTTGPSGPTSAKVLIKNSKVGTSQSAGLGPLKTDWSQSDAASGPNNIERNQIANHLGTGGTTGTTILQRGRGSPDGVGESSTIHASVAELKRSWMAPARWSQFLSDAENFVSQWGATAEKLGWTALDLFGVHPLAPAVRFDVMGLVPILHGATVIAMTADTATIRQASGSLLTYRRPASSTAVLVSEALPR